MKIRELYSLIDSLPKIINVITDEDKHLYIGLYEDAPEEIKDLVFKSGALCIKP